MLHIPTVLLEEYSLNKLPESGLTAVEVHLLVCERCRGRLEEIELVNHIHYTEDGPVYSRATRLSTGDVIARHWGTDLHGGKTFRSVSAARTYLIESFSQLFPEHSCNGSCAIGKNTTSSTAGLHFRYG